MSQIDPTPSEPQPSQPVNPAQSKSAQDVALLNSPFAQMFRKSGAQPTPKEIQEIINGILKQQVTQIKLQDAAWQRAMKKLKNAMNDDG